MQRLLIITPCLNAASLLDDTIMSVVTQSGDFAIHYHVQDGGSSDETVRALEAWAGRLGDNWPRLCRNLVFSFRSEPDTGLYDAINKGFAAHARNLPDDCMMAWINAGDRFAQGAFQTVAAVRRAFADAEWMSGCTGGLSDDGCPVVNRSMVPVSHKAIAAGVHDGRRLDFVQQEGTFWSNGLWKIAGGRVNPALKLAGDFELWRRFAHYAPCHSLPCVTGFYRYHSGRLSGDMRNYFEEMDATMTHDEAVRRDAVFRELLDFASRNDHAALARAGFQGPVVLWNPEAGRWERRMLPITSPNMRRPGPPLPST